MTDRIGQKIGKLTIVKLLHSSARGMKWMGRCDCGKEREIQDRMIRRGKNLSCGSPGCTKVTHGHSARPTPTYRCWTQMRRRCLDPKNDDYANYGGRGIKICERWLKSYPAFLEDMGEKPTPRHEIDREDSDGNYEPDNCRWVTREQNQANRRLTIRVEYQGERRTIPEIASMTGMPYHVIRGRLKQGWTIERAVIVTVAHKGRTS